MAQQTAGRISCPRCGANNFDTVSACWKCGAPIGAGAASPPSGGSADGRTMMVGGPAYATGAQTIERNPTANAYSSYPAPSVAAAITGDPAAARRAAIALALTIPWVGLPVGWVFMMIEDSRKQAIGRLCATWSMLGLVIHLILMYFMTIGTVNLIKSFLPGAMAAGAASHARDLDGSGLPGL